MNIKTSENIAAKNNFPKIMKTFKIFLKYLKEIKFWTIATTDKNSWNKKKRPLKN